MRLTPAARAPARHPRPPPLRAAPPPRPPSSPPPEPGGGDRDHLVPPAGPFCLLPSADAAPSHAASAGLLGAPATYAAPVSAPRRGWRSRWTPPAAPPPPPAGLLAPSKLEVAAPPPSAPLPRRRRARAARPPLVPTSVVYRAAPFRAAADAEARGALRVLFLDDGGGARSRLAAALFDRALAAAPSESRPPVECIAASIGPPAAGPPHPAAVAAAARAGLSLPTPPLLEGDVVGADLALVMDRYDAEEAGRDAAAADAVDRGAFHAARVRLVRPFADAAPAAVPRGRGEDDVEDPFYGGSGGGAALDAALDALVADLAAATSGLAAVVNLVCARCAEGKTSPRLGLLTACLCPLLARRPASRAAALLPPVAATFFPRSRAAPRPMWTEGGDSDTAYVFTVRWGDAGAASSSASVVRFVAPHRYWRDPANVDAALVALAPAPGVLPTQGQLRRAGAGALANGVRALGGFAAAAERTGYASSRRPNGAGRDAGAVLARVRQLAVDGTMPTQAALRAAGSDALVHDVRRAGGGAAVAAALGLALKRPPATAADLRAALAVAAPGALAAGFLPPLSALPDDVRRLIRRLGGVQAAADAAGLDRGAGAAALAEPRPLSPPRRSRGRPRTRPPRAERLAAAVSAARDAATALGRPRAMPSRAALEAAGLGSTAAAIKSAGGFAAVAAAAKLAWRDTRGG